MKILCDRPLLVEVFGVAASIVPVKTPKPIAKNVLLEANEDGLLVQATDFEMSAQLRLDSVKVIEPGTALLPAREAVALLREISDPTVTLETDDWTCHLRSGGGAFELVGADPAEFPRQIDLAEGRSVRIKATQLVKMIRQTAFAAAREETRYAINGLLVDVKEGQMRMVGTDGRRLSLSYQNLVDDDGPPVRMIVPLRALQALLRAIPEGSETEVEVVFSDNQAGFKIGKDLQTLLVTQLLDSRFPDYEGVIPRVAETTVELSRDLLESNLRRVAVLSSGDLRVVRFSFSSSSLEMTAENSGVGRADCVMDVDVKGAGVSIGFNPDYILDAIKVADHEVLRLDMADEETPAKFTMGEAFTYVLMPISSS